MSQVSAAPKMGKERLIAAFAIVDITPDLDDTLARLRDLLKVDHIVYHSSKLGTSPSSDPYIHLTYPAAWVKRYLQMGYINVDPVIREGFLRTLPFEWRELAVQNEQERQFMIDALAHGVGPLGLSIPLRSKRGHRALFSVSFSGAQDEWNEFLAGAKDMLVNVANRIHSRVMTEVFAEERPRLSDRELTCLRWTAFGKSATEIAVILNISPYTAREYLKSCRFKLDSVTSAQAVSKAVKLGLLSI
jgi:LuxR family transcriptional regulator, quorum-sensing system regulator CinR